MKKDLNIYSKMTPKLIAQGAEAKIILSKDIVTKDRISKSYRIPELDKKIRKSRTKAETKLLNKASQIINCPLPINNQSLRGGGVGKPKDFKIKMPFIDGKKLSDHLDKFPLKQQKQICKQIGEDVAKLHDAEIIHGDLTTSNMVLKDNKIFFIDFGLGYISHKFEDKAVDIHLFKQALEAKHFRNWEVLFKEFEKGYSKSKDSKIVFERLKAVEKRGRYKDQ